MSSGNQSIDATVNFWRGSGWTNITREDLIASLRPWVQGGLITRQYADSLLLEFDNAMGIEETPTNDELILTLGIIQPLIQSVMDAKNNPSFQATSDGQMGAEFASYLYDALNLAEQASQQAITKGEINPNLAAKLQYALQQVASKIESKTGVSESSNAQKEKIYAITAISLGAVFIGSVAMYKSDATRENIVKVLQSITYALMFLAIGSGILLGTYWLISSMVNNDYDVGKTLGSMLADLIEAIFEAIEDTLINIATAFAGEVSELYTEAHDWLTQQIDGMLSGGAPDPNRPSIRELELQIVQKLRSRGLTQYNVIGGTGMSGADSQQQPPPDQQQPPPDKYVVQ